MSARAIKPDDDCMCVDAPVLGSFMTVCSCSRSVTHAGNPRSRVSVFCPETGLLIAAHMFSCWMCVSGILVGVKDAPRRRCPCNVMIRSTPGIRSQRCQLLGKWVGAFFRLCDLLDINIALCSRVPHAVLHQMNWRQFRTRQISRRRL